MNKTLISACALALAATTLRADDWVAHLTVDNRFDVYFGTPLATNFFAGGGNSWSTTYTFTALGRPTTDYLYVTTASDHAVAQGFVGDFTNTTTSATANTGNTVWEVFPAGAHLMPIFGMAGTWPANVQPTQAQTDLAIAYATNNSLWQAPDTFTNWDNRLVGNVTTWGHRPGINPTASWIWHNTGVGNPFNPGANHDEFLIFRVAGLVPSPGAAGLLGLAGITLGGRRKRA